MTFRSEIFDGRIRYAPVLDPVGDSSILPVEGIGFRFTIAVALLSTGSALQVPAMEFRLCLAPGQFGSGY